MVEQVGQLSRVDKHPTVTMLRHTRSKTAIQSTGFQTESVQQSSALVKLQVAIECPTFLRPAACDNSKQAAHHACRQSSKDRKTQQSPMPSSRPLPPSGQPSRLQDQRPAAVPQQWRSAVCGVLINPAPNLTTTFHASLSTPYADLYAHTTYKTKTPHDLNCWREPLAQASLKPPALTRTVGTAI